MKHSGSFYERHVKDYQKVTNLWFPQRHKQLIELIHGNPRQILDVGCGTGIMLERIEAKFPSAKFYGVDLSGAMIKFAEEEYPSYEFAVANADSLPFDDAKFDLVTNAISLYHYDNPPRALSETYRVLKPGGQFLLMDIMPKRKVFRKVNDFAAKHIVRDGHVAFRSLASIKAMFEEGEFDRVEQHFIGFPGVYITSGYKPRI